MTGEFEQVGRIAYRVEGTLWVAYYAETDTMDDAIFLGSIRMAGVEKKERKEAFMALIGGMVSELLSARIGDPVRWSDPKPAPEHERGGNA